MEKEIETQSATQIREKYKKKPSKRSLSFIIHSSTSENFALSDSFAPENFQTNLERIFVNLNKIKQKLNLIQETDLSHEIDYMISSLLKNQMNDFIFKVEKEDISKQDELKKILELLAEYSSEFNFRRNIESLQAAILTKKERLSDNKLNSKTSNTDKSFNIRSEIIQSDFNIFNFTEEIGRGETLKTISGNIFDHFNLFDKVNITSFNNFIEEIKMGYKSENPYHNDLHAADVTQTISVIINKSNMIETLTLQNIDVFAFLISAIVHDFKHPGQTNAFQVNFQTEVALQYNDISVLENMHISEAFRIINKQGCDILENFSKDERKLIRKRIVDMILATDMSLHTKLYTNLKLKVENFKLDKAENLSKLFKELDSTFSVYDFQQDALNYTLHAADLSHNVKSFDITEKWTYLLMNEFWNQGDLEKMNNLPVSFNCDRATINVPKGQIGFLNGFIIPTFSLLTQLFPQVEYLVDNAKANMNKWNEIAVIEANLGK